MPIIPLLMQIVPFAKDHWKLIAVGILTISSFFYGWHVGGSRVQGSWDKEKADQALAVLTEKARTDAISIAVDTSWQKQAEKTRTVFRDRIIYRDKEVSHETVERENAGCVVPERFVRMWNSANRAELPGAARRPYELSGRAFQPGLEPLQ